MERLSRLRPGDVLDAVCDSQGNAFVAPTTDSGRRKSGKQGKKQSFKGTDALTFPFDRRDVGWAWTTATPLRPLVASAERAKPLSSIPAHLHEHSDAALLAACRAAAKGEAFDFDLIQRRAAALDDGRRLGAQPHAALRDRMAHLRALLWLEEASTTLDLEAADVHEPVWKSTSASGAPIILH